MTRTVADRRPRTTCPAIVALINEATPESRPSTRRRSAPGSATPVGAWSSRSSWTSGASLRAYADLLRAATESTAGSGSTCGVPDRHGDDETIGCRARLGRGDARAGRGSRSCARSPVAARPVSAVPGRARLPARSGTPSGCEIDLDAPRRRSPCGRAGISVRAARAGRGARRLRRDRGGLRRSLGLDAGHLRGVAPLHGRRARLRPLALARRAGRRRDRRSLHLPPRARRARARLGAPARRAAAVAAARARHGPARSRRSASSGSGACRAVGLGVDGENTTGAVAPLRARGHARRRTGSTPTRRSSHEQAACQVPRLPHVHGGRARHRLPVPLLRARVPRRARARAARVGARRRGDGRGRVAAARRIPRPP